MRFVERGKGREGWQRIREVETQEIAIVTSVRKLILPWLVLVLEGEDVMYDQMLFNQQKGMDSGFGNDDQCNVYEKRLFTAQSTLSSLYRPKKDVDADTYGGADEQLDKIMKTDCFKPHKGFGGTIERAGMRDGPVEFDQDVKEADPFGLDEILAKTKKAK